MPWLLAHVSPRKNDTAEAVSCCAEEDGLQKSFGDELASSSASRNQNGRSKGWEMLLRAVLDTALAGVSYLL